MSDSIVIIPTYNEEENISTILHYVMNLPKKFDVLVIDDNSPDKTVELVHKVQAEFPDRIHLEQRKGKLGLGTAYIHGFKWCLERDYDYIFEMDADFSHNPDDLERLYNACKDGADVSVGSRYIKGGKVENWPFDRLFLSRGASFYVRLITWMPVKDATAGFVCYTRKVLQEIDLDKIKFVGYAFQIEMKFTAWKLGFKIKEVPITFKDRIYGVSKMSGKIFKEAVWGVISLKIESLARSFKKQ